MWQSVESELKGVRKGVFLEGCYNDGIRIQELGEMALNTMLEPEQGDEGMHMAGVGVTVLRPVWEP